MELACVKSQFGDPVSVATQRDDAARRIASGEEGDPEEPCLQGLPVSTAEPLPWPQSNGLFLILVRMKEMTYLLSRRRGSALS